MGAAGRSAPPHTRIYGHPPKGHCSRADLKVCVSGAIQVTRVSLSVEQESEVCLVCDAMRRCAISAILLVLASRVSAVPKERRLGFVASTNGGHETFGPIAATLLEHASSWNVAHAYCSSPGLVTNATVLPSPPFCWDNWTVPIREAAPHVAHVPIIQMLGNSGPSNFKHPYIFAAKYVAWAQSWNFSGYLLDAEFKGDDAAFAAFLNVFADALHAVNKTLGVFLYPDLGKKDLVNATRADYW